MRNESFFNISLPARLKLIKIVVALGAIASLLICSNLWAGQRWYPYVSLIDGIPIIPAPYDWAGLVVVGLLLFMIAFLPTPRWWILAFLVVATYLVMVDVTRLQPWFYHYCLILFVLMFYNWRVDEASVYTTLFVTLQLLVVAVYFYSGVQKLNPHFLEDTYPWFVEPFGAVFTGRQMDMIQKLGPIIPYVEALGGLMLLVRPLRFIAIPVMVVMHLIVIVSLGPSGKSYNHVVWPWNIVMICMVLLLFAGNTKQRYFSPQHLFGHFSFYVIVLTMWVLPLFCLYNRWPSYLSSSLYTGNTDNGNIHLSDQTYQRLPLYVKHWCYKGQEGHVLYVKYWCMNELNVPGFPEKFVFEDIRNQVARMTNGSKEEVVLEYTPRLPLLGTK